MLKSVVGGAVVLGRNVDGGLLGGVERAIWFWLKMSMKHFTM